jgi:hypothetical protein
MPVDGALAMTEVAFGVAFWKTGLLIKGLTVAVGVVVLVFLNGAIGAGVTVGFTEDVEGDVTEGFIDEVGTGGFPDDIVTVGFVANVGTGGAVDDVDGDNIVGLEDDIGT